MTVEEMQQRVADITTNMGKNLQTQLSAIIASDMVEVVKKRWLDIGATSTGTILYYSAKYKQWRQKLYQVGHKDFMISGDMWRSVQVKSVKSETNKITVTYGPIDNYGQELISGHNDREGTNILMPNAEEILVIQNSIGELITEQIRNNLGR